MFGIMTYSPEAFFFAMIVVVKSGLIYLAIASSNCMEPPRCLSAYVTERTLAAEFGKYNTSVNRPTVPHLVTVTLDPMKPDNVCGLHLRMLTKSLMLLCRCLPAPVSRIASAGMYCAIMSMGCL